VKLIGTDNPWLRMYSYEELPHTDTIISFSLNIEKSVVF